MEYRNERHTLARKLLPWWLATIHNSHTLNYLSVHIVYYHHSSIGWWWFGGRYQKYTCNDVEAGRKGGGRRTLRELSQSAMRFANPKLTVMKTGTVDKKVIVVVAVLPFETIS